MNAVTITPPPGPPLAPGAGPAPAVTPSAVGPAPYRWTIAAYRKLALTGLFHDLKTMLLHGELYVMALPDPPHNLSLGLAADWLAAAFGDGYHVRDQMGFDVGTDNDPGPDIAVVAGSRRDLTGRTPTQAVLVIEVAASSLSIDTTKKAELYATASVPDYWVIDLNGRQLIVFRDPRSLPAELGVTAYQSRLTFGPADTVSPLAAPGATVRVADLLP